MLFTPGEIQETVNMFMRQKLDVRAITMGISLRDCACSDGKESRRRIRDKILRYAGKLVETGRAIESEFGVPIINKRVAVTPISLVAEPSGEKSYVEWAITLEELAKELGSLENICVKGLMTVAPYDPLPENNRIYFRRMKELFETIKSRNYANVDMQHLSMGMTNDYEVAVEEGADIVRIGTGIFGARDYTNKQ